MIYKDPFVRTQRSAQLLTKEHCQQRKSARLVDQNQTTLSLSDKDRLVDSDLTTFYPAFPHLSRCGVFPALFFVSSVANAVAKFKAVSQSGW
jgi:hypothetical protein